MTNEAQRSPNGSIEPFERTNLPIRQPQIYHTAGLVPKRLASDVLGARSNVPVVFRAQRSTQVLPSAGTAVKIHSQGSTRAARHLGTRREVKSMFSAGSRGIVKVSETYLISLATYRERTYR